MVVPSNKYLHLVLSELKEGDMFFVKLNSIQGFNMMHELIVNYELDKYDADLENFQHNFSLAEDFKTIDENESMQETRDKSITLVKYLGDGKFLEYYTGSIISYIDLENDEPYANFVEFMKEYNEYVKNPLFIRYGLLLPIDNVNLRCQFAKQKKHENYIQNVIYAMCNECIDNLQKGLEKIGEQDRIFADIENEAEDMIRTFAKTELKK